MRKREEKCRQARKVAAEENGAIIICDNNLSPVSPFSIVCDNFVGVNDNARSPRAYDF